MKIKTLLSGLGIAMLLSLGALLGGCADHYYDEPHRPRVVYPDRPEHHSKFRRERRHAPDYGPERGDGRGNDSRRRAPGGEPVAPAARHHVTNRTPNPAPSGKTPPRPESRPAPETPGRYDDAPPPRR